MKNSKVINFLEICKNRGYVLNLENVQNTLKQFNNPDEKLNIIHVAGTNGKGSTSTFIENILMEEGYKVGLYTSPSVITFYERIKINNIEIKEEDFEEIVLEVMDITEKSNIPITEFEVLTVVAIIYFAKNNCDYVILEVGMGGRLDATNGVGKTLLSIITNIGKDHTEYLGNTLEKIAYEKAGIIRENTPLILYNQDEKVINMIKEEADKLNSKINIVKFDSIIIKEMNIKHTVFDYENYKNLEISLLGEHQTKNAVMAINAIEELKKLGVLVSEESIYNGIKKAKIVGRFQVLNNDPLVIIDGAHNIQGVKALNKTLKEMFPMKKFVFITGFLKDKDYMSAIESLAPIAKAFIAVEPNSTRALNSQELKDFIGFLSDESYNAQKMDIALDFVLENYNEEIIVILGSFYQVKDAVEYFDNKK